MTDKEIRDLVRSMTDKEHDVVLEEIRSRRLVLDWDYPGAVEMLAPPPTEEQWQEFHRYLRKYVNLIDDYALSSAWENFLKEEDE